MLIERVVQRIKNTLHITDEEIEHELMPEILSAIEDMQRVGVTAADIGSNSGLIIKCVELYVKWQIDYLGQAERFQKNYERLRDSLSQGSDYNSES